MDQKNITNPYGVAPNEVNSNQQQFAESKSNTLAIVSLILGIISLGLYFFTAIPGIITGHMARSRVKRNPAEYSGKGMALAGLILSYIMLFISFAAGFAFFYFILSDPEAKAAFYKGFDVYNQQ